jgi:hypothetical protein
VLQRLAATAIQGHHKHHVRNKKTVVAVTNRFRAVSLVACAFAALPTVGNALNLLGSTVTSQYYAFGDAYGFGGSPATFIVDGTVQQTFCAYAACDKGFTLRITSNRIIYTFFTPEPWFWSTGVVSLDSDGLYIENGNLLTFSDTLLQGISLDEPHTDMPGFTASNITFNDHSIAINWAGLSGWEDGQQVVLKTKVPEPNALALLAIGLAGLGFSRRRKVD